MRRRILRWLGIGVVSAVVLAWAVGEIAFTRTNPPERHSGFIVSPNYEQVLRDACFDCHSNETRYPWYTYVPVANLLSGRDVYAGRSELNFSHWDRMSAEQRREAASESAEAVREGEMPPWFYTPLHPEAQLASQDLRVLQDGARSLGGRPDGGAESEEDDY